MAVCFQLLVLVVSGAYGLGPGLATSAGLGAGVQLVLRAAGLHADDRRHAQLDLPGGLRGHRRHHELPRRRLPPPAPRGRGAPPRRGAARGDGPDRARPDRGRPARRRGRPRGRPGPRGGALRASLLERPGPRTTAPGGADRADALGRRASWSRWSAGERRARPARGRARALPDAEPRWATPGFATAVAGLAAVAVERGAPDRGGPGGRGPAAQRRAQDRAAARRLARVPHPAHRDPHGGARPLGAGDAGRPGTPRPCSR